MLSEVQPPQADGAVASMTSPPSESFTRLQAIADIGPDAHAFSTDDKDGLLKDDSANDNVDVEQLTH